jgi:hypothetical protein
VPVQVHGEARHIGRGAGRGARRLAVAALAAAALLVPGAALAAGVPFSGPAADVERLAVAYRGGALRVYDEVALANPGAAPLRRVRLPLPRGAADVRLVSGFPAGAAGAVSGDRLAAPVDVPAGGRADLIYTYRLPARRLPASFERAITLPTARFAVLVTAGTLAVRSPQLADVGVQRLNGLSVHAYAAEGLPPGRVIRLTVAPPPTWLDRLAARFSPAVWMAVAAALLAGLLAVGLRRGPGAGTAGGPGGPGAAGATPGSERSGPPPEPGDAGAGAV